MKNHNISKIPIICMIPLIRNGVLSLDFLSLSSIINNVLLLLLIVEFRSKINVLFMRSKSCSPVRYGLSISGAKIASIPYMKCQSWRTGELFVCQISMTQTLMALFQTPPLIPSKTKHRYSNHILGKCGVKAVKIPINNTKNIDVIWRLRYL